MLGRDVVAVGAQAAEVGRAGGDELAPPVGEVRRDLDADVRHQPARLGDQPLHVLDASTGHGTRRARQARGSGQRAGGRRATPVRQYARAAASAISRRLLPVVALVGHEVLQDHLLDVPVLGVHRGERLERFHALLLGLADADEDAARERDPQLARRADRLQAPRRVLGRRARVHGLHQPLGHRLEHQPLRRGHLAQPREVLARRARRGWCAAAAPARARARRSTPRSR